MNNHINWRQAFLAIGISWLVYLIVSMTWAQAGEFVFVPVILTTCALAARFRYWAAGLALVLVGLLMLYVYEVPAAIADSVASAYTATRDPLAFALEKTQDKLAVNGGNVVSAIGEKLDSTTIRLTQEQKDSMLEVAKARRENDAFIQQVAETAGIAKSKPHDSASTKTSDVPKQTNSTFTVTYSAREREKIVCQVPPHSKVVLTAATNGYVCDLASGVCTTVQGQSDYVSSLLYPAGFPAQHERIFCLLAKLDGGDVVAFKSNEITLPNLADDAVDCIVLLNERNDWNDNTGEIQITAIVSSL